MTERADGDAAAAVTTVTLGERRETVQSTEEVLYGVPGARVIDSGALGSFSSVSLRGAQLNQTTVLLDTFALTGPDTGAFDLSLIPLAALDRVEVYRGGAPLRYSDGAIGGVVRLVPRAGGTRDPHPLDRAGEKAAAPRLLLRASAGSFGTYGSAAGVQVPGARARWFSHVGLRRSRGDFAYRDDNGTRFVSDDDVTRARENGDLLEAHAFSYGTGGLGDGRWHAALLAVGRRRGEPGPASSPALFARRQRVRSVGFVGYRLDGANHRLQVQVGGGLDQNRFSDRFAEIGTGREETDDRVLTGQARALGGVDLAPWLQWSGVGTVRWDHLAPEDRFEGGGGPNSSRWLPALATELRAHGTVLQVPTEARASIRWMWSVASIEDGDRRVDSVPTARLSLALATTPWLTVVGSTFAGVRLPSIVELFGNRGSLEANPGLREERSVGADGGARARFCLAAWCARGEVRGFWSRTTDLIRYRRTSQFTAVAENVARGNVFGVEGHAQLEGWEALSFTQSLTFLQTASDGGDELPFQPRWQSSSRLDLRVRGVSLIPGVEPSLHGEVVHTGANFVDPANLVRLPARTWVHAGARVEAFSGGLFAAFQVRDVTDEGGSDLIGFPLPGRRWFVHIGSELEF